ncbi:PGF-pre-PGF domain-containing protein [Candidatus Woesearchaeota archaeon]|nr:PGF-pre-PGF domain-containing protein [Candidatus Woesearchaeota archaeon]
MARLSVVLSLMVALVLLPSAIASGVVFYNPAWNPQDGLIFDEVEPDTPYTFKVKNLDIAITRITFSVSREAQNAGITVYNLMTVPNSLPVVPQNTSYQFNEIRYAGFASHETGDFNYDFKVSKKWLENNSFSRDSISLFSFNRILDVWDLLPTTITGEDSFFVFYSAEQDKGVHFLYIGSSKKSMTESVIETIGEPVDELVLANEDGETLLRFEDADMDAGVEKVVLDSPVVDSPVAPEPELSTEPQARSSESYAGITFLLLVIVVLVIVLLVVFGNRIFGKRVDKELHAFIRDSFRRGRTREQVRSRLIDVGWSVERVDKALDKHRKKIPVEKKEPADDKKNK